jgi:hypothetical protein
MERISASLNDLLNCPKAAILIYKKIFIEMEKPIGGKI